MTDKFTESESGLRTSEIRYRRLFEAARDGIIILNAVTLQITDVNPFMTELLGYSREELLGKELWEIGLFSDKETSQKTFRELQLKGYIRYEDLPLETIDGKLREVEFVSNVYEESGNQVIQCNIRDITERKEAEEVRRRLLESEQAAHAEADLANGVKDQFLALLSHELRTPLTSILGWADLLITGKLDEATTKRALEVIVRNSRAQRQLIDDLLDISSIITGKLRLDVRPLELAPIIEAVVESVRPAVDAKSLQLETELDSAIGPILGDAARIQQIIWNILSNAIKFTPKGGRVHVRMERVDSYVEITMRDTGQGIQAEFLPHVFERFRQFDSSSRRKHGGLGLGLSIVRQLVELHGGTAEAESPGAGAGTTVKVKLPVTNGHHELSERTQSIIAGHSSTNGPPSLTGLRVLVVDDESDSRDFVAQVLKGRGADVISRGSAVEALAALAATAPKSFDVLISDIGMPLMDGYALVEEIRRLPSERGGRTPAVALTAYAGIEDRMRVLAAGYQMHIPKPIEPIELINAVANLAEKRMPDHFFQAKKRPAVASFDKEVSF